MTKNELKWRLSDLPTGGEVADLVSEGVITKEEARGILFNEGEDKGKKVQELEEEVKFLRDLCDKLAAKSNGWTTITREYKDFTPRYPHWYNSYSTIMKATPSPYTITANSMQLTSGAIGQSTTTTNVRMLGKLN